MTKYLKKSNTFWMTDASQLDIHTLVPPGTYTINATDQGELYLQEIEGFTFDKLYGNVHDQSDRILNTFKDRKVSTGLLLDGEKGTGKTLLAKVISIKGIKDNIPTIVINRPLFGESFNKFLQKIDQECIVIFDEYEKVYHEPSWQDALLTLLDGVFPTKKLFILTTNDRYQVSTNMINRPGRLFYNISYRTLDPKFIREYAKDTVKDKKMIDKVCNLCQLFERFNFDMLKAMIEEMNRYDESPQKAIEMMNIKIDSYSAKFEVTVEVDDVSAISYEHSVDPMKAFRIYYYLTEEDQKADKDKCVDLKPDECTELKLGKYTFIKKNVKVILKKKQVDTMDYTKFAMERYGDM